MLDKKRVKTWVKVVAWGLAIVFGTSFSFLFMMPTTQQTNSRSGPIVTDSTPEEQARSLVGQAEIASDNGDLAQAIDFYEQALSLDEENEDTRSELAAAYYKQGTEAYTEDATTAAVSFNKYLDVLPDGPRADEVRELLKSTAQVPESPSQP